MQISSEPGTYPEAERSVCGAVSGGLRSGPQVPRAQVPKRAWAGCVHEKTEQPISSSLEICYWAGGERGWTVESRIKFRAPLCFSNHFGQVS